jgi:sugar/nucleoside kinase (ribokinase family)
MPRLLAVGHVTWDRIQGQEQLGGSVSYGALAARRLGWEVAVLTSAAADFEPARDLPGITAFVGEASATTRFQNDYDEDGTRHQVLQSRAADIDLTLLPDDWRSPDVLLLCPVAGEVHGPIARSFTAEVVGATAQGWLRQFEEDGSVEAREWSDAASELAGVHALVYSEQDVPDPEAHARQFLQHVPMVIVTRGWRGLTLFARSARHDVPALPCTETDPTGAGDVFATAFLLRYQESGDPLEAAAFGSCAASCVVEGLGTSALGDRGEVERRLEKRERFVQGEDVD